MRLVAKSAEEADRYLGGSWRHYANDVASELGIGLDDALERTRRQLDSILPQGRDTPGHHFFDIVDDEPVGSLWVAEVDGDLFIYDIMVDEAHRGRGLGTAAMRAAEDLARKRGAAGIGLSVFAHNEGAIRLYERLGYEVVEKGTGGQRMRKGL
ncbi:MAG: GNAT family N-acetyltransferase [Planctomycetota bacterium]|jgi:ribosomal protein S18 acetylase RimI-like enzyme